LESIFHLNHILACPTSLVLQGWSVNRHNEIVTKQLVLLDMVAVVKDYT